MSEEENQERVDHRYRDVDVVVEEIIDNLEENQQRLEALLAVVDTDDDNTDFEMIEQMLLASEEMSTLLRQDEYQNLEKREKYS